MLFTFNFDSGLVNRNGFFINISMAQLMLTLEGICIGEYVCICVGVREREAKGKERRGGEGENRGEGERMRMNMLIRNYLAQKKSNLVINDYPFRGNQCQQKLP